MELISREEAIREISLLRLPDNDTNYCIKAHNDAIDRSQETISQCSTIESRPKGKWLREEYYFDEWVDECSVCGEAYTMIDGTATENNYNFCPNCGADMRGEE